MNKVCLVGRLTKDPTCEYVNTNNGSVARARFTIAVDRGFASNNQDGNNNRTADFISVVAWRKQAENITKFQKKGNQIAVDGRIQVDNYTNKDGQKVYGMQIIANNIEFAESKNASQSNTDSMPVGDAAPAPAAQAPTGDAGDGFMSIPDGIVDELPFG